MANPDPEKNGVSQGSAMDLATIPKHRALLDGGARECAEGANAGSAQTKHKIATVNSNCIHIFNLIDTANIDCNRSIKIITFGFDWARRAFVGKRASRERRFL